ncbi:MAG: hypothetical protein ACP5N2_05600 [Candidatus Nanoarchaeia archaeon]
MSKTLSKMRTLIGLKSRSTANQKITLVDYLNKKYKAPLQAIVNLYGDNQDILELKEKLSSSGIIEIKNQEKVVELRNNIKKLTRFITNVEIPAYEQVFRILDNLQQFEAKDDKSKILISQIKEQITILKNSDIYKVLKEQKNALEHSNLQEYKLWYDKQKKIDSWSKITITPNNTKGSLHKTKRFFPIAAAIAFALLFMLTDTPASRAQNNRSSSTTSLSIPQSASTEEDHIDI